MSNLNDKSIILKEIKILSRDISSIDDNGKMRSYLKKIKRKIRKKKVNYKFNFKRLLINLLIYMKINLFG